MTPPESGATAPRVLVVSAASDAIDFLVALLARAGFDAHGASADEAAATTTSASPAFDLVLVDTDPESVRSIRSLADPDRAHTTIAVLGPIHGDTDAEAEAETAGADAWISRPIDDTDLISAVRDATGGD